MKPVPPENKGLSKLPKGVRNKMGYMAVGGMTKKKDEVKRVGGVSGMPPSTVKPPKIRENVIAPKPRNPFAVGMDKNEDKPKKPKRSIPSQIMGAVYNRAMAGGGMMKGYAKGGMANCGASMKPNGAARGK